MAGRPVWRSDGSCYSAGTAAVARGVPKWRGFSTGAHGGGGSKADADHRKGKGRQDLAKAVIGGKVKAPLDFDTGDEVAVKAEGKITDASKGDPGHGGQDVFKSMN